MITREWREQHKGELESGEELLGRILVARREAWQSAQRSRSEARGRVAGRNSRDEQYVDPSSAEPSSQFDIPVGWTCATIEQLCIVETGSTPRRSEEKYYRDGQINWVTSSAVNEALISSPSETITPLALAETNAKVFPVGTLVIAMYGEGSTRGKISELGIKAATNQACAALLCGHLHSAVKSQIRTYFQMNYEAVRARAAGGVQPNLNLSMIKAIVLPLPPLEEALEIQRRLGDHLVRLRALEEPLLATHQTCALEKSSILCAAFTGRLVPRDPNDEPATVLLGRIAAERAAAKPESKPARAKRKPRI
jgi:type I restriction enzyme S subunit